MRRAFERTLVVSCTRSNIAASGHHLSKLSSEDSAAGSGFVRVTKTG